MASAKKSSSPSTKKNKMGSPMKKKSSSPKKNRSSPSKKSNSTTNNKKKTSQRTGSSSKRPKYQQMVTETLTSVRQIYLFFSVSKRNKLLFLAPFTKRFNSIKNYELS